MIPLSFRLLFKSGREAIWRLIAIVVGVALGVTVLLTILSAFTAIKTYDARSAWLNTEGQSLDAGEVAPAKSLLWNRNIDWFDGHMIDRFDIADNNSGLSIPGAKTLPAQGEYYVSPALDNLLRSQPKNQLADRYGTKQLGVLESSSLGSTNRLIVIVGRSVADYPKDLSPSKVTSINTEPRSTDGTFLRMVLSVGAAGVIFPAAMFVLVSTRLAAARREERFAAIRLVGGTKRQLILLSTVETLVGAVIGLVVGSLLFLPMPYILSKFEFVGMQFSSHSLYVTPIQLGIVFIGVLLTTALISYISLRKIDVSPLGVARKAPAKPPRMWRMLPLLAGILWTAYMAFNNGDNANELTMIGVFLLCGVGVFLVGPIITRAMAHLLKRFDGGPSTLIAGSRLLAQPASIFRSVSGVVIAIFVVSVFSSIMHTYIGDAMSSRTPVVSDKVLTVDLNAENDSEKRAQYQTIEQATKGSGDIASRYVLYAIPENIQPHVLTLHANGQTKENSPEFLMPCTTSQALGFGKCKAGEFLAVPSYALFDRQYPPEGWQYFKVDVNNLTPSRILFSTNGSVAAIERVRTKIVQATDGAVWSLTDAELYASGVRIFTQLQALASIGTLVVLAVAGCSLLVAVADSLLERKRPFTLLRLTGMKLSQLRLAVLLEAAVPLIATALLAACTGTLLGDLLMKATSDAPLMGPSVEFVFMLMLGIILSLAIVMCTLPLLYKVTRAENARFE